jgi:hypothetical protein
VQPVPPPLLPQHLLQPLPLLLVQLQQLDLNNQEDQVDTQPGLGTPLRQIQIDH